MNDFVLVESVNNTVLVTTFDKIIVFFDGQYMILSAPDALDTLDQLILVNYVSVT